MMAALYKHRWSILWHAAIVLAAAWLLMLGVKMRFDVLPAVALVEWDTRGWLEPAMRWADGGEFRENAEREWLYAAFLAGCLKCFGNFSSIVWVQWIAGIVGGVLLFVAWQMWTSMLPKRLLTGLITAIGGLFVLAAYILNPNLAAFEMSVRPEAILGVCVIAAYFCVTGFVKYRWFRTNERLAFTFGVPLPFLAVAIGILKPSWALALPWIIFPLLLALVGKRPWSWWRVLPLAVGSALAFVLLTLPEKLVFKKSPEARVVLPMTLLTIHADAVVAAMQKRLLDPDLPTERRALLESALPVLESDFAKSKDEPLYYKRLGFDPDYIMYRARIFSYLQTKHGFTKADLAAFCNQSFYDAWLLQPGMMINKAWRQLGYIAFPDARTYTKREVKLQGLTRHSNKISADTLDDSYTSWMQQAYAIHRAESVAAGETERQIRSWRALDNFLKKHIPPALPAAMVALVLAVVALWIPAFRSLSTASLLCCLYFAIPAGNALTISLVHALDNDRYRMSYGMVLLFAITATVVLLASFVIERVAALLGSQSKHAQD